MEQTLLYVLVLAPYTGHEFLLSIASSLGFCGLLGFLPDKKIPANPADILRSIQGFEQVDFEIWGTF
jgi:hypothetical protein